MEAKSDNKRNLPDHNHLYDWIRLMDVVRVADHRAIYVDLWKCSICGDFMTTSTEGYI